MFVASNTDTLKCPITCELFREPVTGQDGHTYERDAIIAWLQKAGTSPIAGDPMTIDSLRPNHVVKQLVDEFKSSSLQKHFLFKFGIDIRKAGRRPIFQTQGKYIYRAEWISKPGPDVVLLKIEGAKANREAAYYVQLGSHPHIVHTYGMVENDFNALMLVQEYATEGDLAHLLKENEFQPPQLVLLEIFLQIIDAMVYLANYGIVHGDLACRNVLVFRLHNSNPQENLVKLTDFGLTRASTLYSVVGSTASTTLVVVPLRYAAPEILLSAGLSNYSEKSDVYSMGILMWEACSQGQLPYGSIDDDNEVRRLKIKGEILSQPENCDEKLWNIIVQCWHQQPDIRPTFKMLKESLLELHPRSIISSNSIKNKSAENETNLIKLDLTTHNINDDKVQHVADILQGNTTLRELNLEKNRIGLKGARQIARALRNNQTLIELNISHNQIGDVGTQHLAEALCQNEVKQHNIILLINNLICQEQNKLIDRLRQLAPKQAAYLSNTTRINQVLKILHICNNTITDRGAMHLSATLKHNNILTTLNLGHNQIGDTGVQHITEALINNQTLTTLDLHSNQISDTGAQHIADALTKNQTLTALDLRSNKISNIGAQHIADGLTKNQTLTALDLGWKKISDTGAQHIAEALTKNQTLTTLNLGWNKISNIGAQHIADALTKNQTLTTLNLGWNKISNIGAQHIADALTKNQTLTTLNLGWNKISDTGAQHIAEALTKNQTLTALDLGWNKISDTGAQHIAEALAKNQTLTALDLGWNKISNIGAQHIADALTKNQTLTALDLAENQISETGAEHIAEALINNQTLTTLNLGWNEIGDTGAQHIADALTKNQTLTALYLGWNKISNIGAQHIADALTKNQDWLAVACVTNAAQANGIVRFSWTCFLKAVCNGLYLGCEAVVSGEFSRQCRGRLFHVATVTGMAGLTKQNLLASNLPGRLISEKCFYCIYALTYSIGQLDVVEEVEIFKIYLECWNIASAELYREVPFQQTVPLYSRNTNSTPTRRQFYGVILSKCNS
ncbi:unnamed protein product [Rotaria socialis]